MLNPKIPLIVVAGPTASGKSALAVSLAEHFKGEVLNIDSVQVYRGFDIGAGKITEEERRGIPHHLLSIKHPSETYNVADFTQDAHKIIADIHTRKKSIIAVGGTTLYLRALLHGLADLPPGSFEIRLRYASLSSEELYSLLQKQDEERANALHVHDRKRVMRALETYELTGLPASKLIQRHAHASQLYTALIVVLVWPRKLLYESTQDRTKKMLSDGLILEAEALYKEFGPILPLTSLGYAQVVEYLRGELAKDSLYDEITKATRRFAKRQITFWRNEPRKRGWLMLPEQIEERGKENLKARKNKDPLELQSRNLTRDELVEKLSERLKKGLGNIEVWYLNGEHLGV